MKPDEDRSIETLIRLAGERETPSAAASARARLAAEQSWRRMLDEPAQRARWRMPLVYAAALGLAAIAIFCWTRRDAAAPATVVARIVALEGSSTLRQGDSRLAAVPDAKVMSGSTLSTADGRVAASFADALSLRLNAKTALRFDGHDRVTLLYGTLYVDSGGLNAGPPLTIATPAGDIRHVGTQFQVQVSGDTTRIRVREGRVALRRDSRDETRLVAAGDELEVLGDEEHWRHGLPFFGQPWEWTASVATALAIDDRPMAEFLAWITREHGWQLHYSDEEVQNRTHAIRLHGSLDGLSSAAMLERVSLVTGIPLAVRDGVLWVGGLE